VESEAQDTLARVLAIAGLGVGLFATVISLLTYLRDRPQLVVRGTKGHDVTGGRTTYEVTVANHGKQPVSVTAAGLRYQEPGFGPTRIERLLRRPEKPRAGDFYVSFFSGARLLGPGEVQSFDMDHEVVAQTLLAGVREAEWFAMDSRSRLVKAAVTVDLAPFELAGAD
jgi:hypothetical protein